MPYRLELPDHLLDREGDNMPELVRIDPQRVYVKGNVIVVSRRAAHFIEFFRAMRAGPDELRRFADLMEGEQLPYAGRLHRICF